MDQESDRLIVFDNGTVVTLSGGGGAPYIGIEDSPLLVGLPCVPFKRLTTEEIKQMCINKEKSDD